jgi:hypothetical protein
MEVVLPAEMTVKESHDISLELQHKVGSHDMAQRGMAQHRIQLRVSTPLPCSARSISPCFGALLNSGSAI